MAELFRNFKNVGKCAYGRGSFARLGDIIAPHRKQHQAYMVFIVDDYFKDKPLSAQIPAESQDWIEFVYCGGEEPKTSQIDALRDKILAERGLPAGVVGIGGGSAMDIAKALSLMLTNAGSSVQYQGLNLIKNPGVYHVGVPTISGTGAEVSMTAVLTGPTKKLGIKCDYTVFDQIVLDPGLTASVPKNQWFYTGMDCYIHCVEAMTGFMKNTFSEAYGYKALEMCEQVFLGSQAGQNPVNDEKLMVASLMGGLSLTYSEVGICHALSYGLSFVLGTRHGIANCICFNQLEDYYPEGVRAFKQMVDQHQIEIPEGLAKQWSEAQIDKMAEIALGLSHMWQHALGPDWQNKVDPEQIKAIYRRM